MEEDQRISSDGYIKFAKDEIEREAFTIMVTKNERYLDKYVHFTLIASTKETNMRLESGVAHYETIPSKNSVDYVFEYEKNTSILLSFYTHNIKADVDLKLAVSNADEYDKKENTVYFQVDR